MRSGCLQLRGTAAGRWHPLGSAPDRGHAIQPGVLRLQPATGAEERLDWIRKNPTADEVNALFSDLAADLLDPHAPCLRAGGSLAGHHQAY